MVWQLPANAVARASELFAIPFLKIEVEALPNPIPQPKGKQY
jgi:hypothetical protein